MSTYNPVLGRFMQAVPFIQQAENLQSYNRYSYVLNNPMSYTDPSGYFLKKLMQVTGVTAAMKFLASNPFLNGIVMAALNFIPGCQGWCSAAFAAVQSYAVTGSLGGALRSGLFAYVGTGIGALGNLGGLAGFAASGVAGGVLNVLQGGKFGHGFVSAGLGASLGGRGGNVRNPFGQVLVSAVIGGTISKVTGGKFINGAGSAAFAAALRADWARSYKRQGAAADPISDEEKLQFKTKFAQLKLMTSKAGKFNSSDDAASWLHDNIQSALDIDVEVGAYIYGSNESGFSIGELYTDYMRSSVSMVMVGQAHSSWHSHGTNSFYWRPSAGISNDSGNDVSESLNYGYTSTSWNGGTLWRFNASSFQGNHSWDNTCKYLNNMSGGRGC